MSLGKSAASEVYTALSGSFRAGDTCESSRSGRSCSSSPIRYMASVLGPSKPMLKLFARDCRSLMSGRMTERESADWAARREVPQLMDEDFQPFRLGHLFAPLADQEMRAKRPADSAHVIVLLQRFELARETDRQSCRGRIDGPLELVDKLLHFAGVGIRSPSADANHLEADAAVALDDGRRLAAAPVSLLP